MTTSQVVDVMDRTFAEQPAKAVRPFGLTKAVPVRPVAGVWPSLRLCSERQISVTVDGGEPFIHAPSMGSQFETVAQTTEDSQLDEEKANDTD
ncbi:putative ATP-grasp-modified RiPP [Streptomyces sp. NBC_01506]|uniref:putative ATP-grasp-modified RiPP n=1 Tax=Streptomyces sp. NBC_01506 TaxID=2903887 RepID=UPI00386CBB7D